MEPDNKREITKKFAGFAGGLQYEDLPPEAIARLKLCMLDTIGCALFGSTLPWGKIITRFSQETGGTAEASLWGSSGKVPVLGAALANGTLVHSFEIDDLHKDSIVHLGAVTLPPVLALAERKGRMDGRSFLTALAAGYEVGARIGVGMGLNHFKRGFHPTGTIGAFAAGAAAGRMLNLNGAQMVQALGIAGSQGAGLMAAQYSSMVKRLHAGRAAQSGLLAATLAGYGFTGIENVIEAEYGGFASSMSDRFDLEKMIQNLGREFEILNVGFKPYASVGVSHTPIDAIKGMKKEESLQPDDIQKVKVWANKATILHAGWEYKPNAITTAQMNLYYCLAAVIEENDAFVDQFTEEKIRDPKILRHIPKIEIIHDESLDRMPPEERHFVRVEITDHRGNRYERSVTHAKGSYRNPMTREEVVEKFRKLAMKVLGREIVDRIEGTVLGLEKEGNAGMLGGLLRING